MRYLPGLLIAMAAASAADIRNFSTWTEYEGGADSSQYSSLKQINKNNVKQLQVAWTYQTGERGNYIFNPIVVDGVMYVLAKNNSFVALDAATGKELWTHPNMGAVGARGINYWESKDRSDRRLLYINGGFLTAIDARTGKTIDSFGDNGRTDLRTGLDREAPRALQTSNPGRIFENLMIIPLPAGGASYDSNAADIHAYDTRTGKLVWQFHTVPHPGEVGYDTWPPDAWKTVGGVHNWSEMTVDEKHGIAFIPLGTPRYDFYGANRKGDNLFGNSLVALDARTGKRLWHFQMVHHDLWDYDLPVAPKLITVKHDGKNVDAVAQGTKFGFLFVFNRLTGQPLWPIEERAVPQTDVPGEWTSPTQPFPTKPPPFARQSFTEKDINPFLPTETGQDSRAAQELAQRGPVHAAQPARHHPPHPRSQLGYGGGRSHQGLPLRGLARAPDAPEARSARRGSRGPRRRGKRRSGRAAKAERAPAGRRGRLLRALQLAHELPVPDLQHVRHGTAVVHSDRLRSQHRHHQVAGSQRRHLGAGRARPRRYRRPPSSRRTRRHGRRPDLRRDRVRPQGSRLRSGHGQGAVDL